MNSTPESPRALRCFRKADQPALSSLAPSQIPRISRKPSWFRRSPPEARRCAPRQPRLCPDGRDPMPRAPRHQHGPRPGRHHSPQAPQKRRRHHPKHPPRARPPVQRLPQSGHVPTPRRQPRPRITGNRTTQRNHRDHSVADDLTARPKSPQNSLNRPNPRNATQTS